MYGPFSDYLRNKKPFSFAQLRLQLRQPLACVATYAELSGGGNGYFPHQYLLPAAMYALGCASHASFAVALLPMSMYQMSSISADALWLALCLGWLGVVSGIASGTLHPRRAAPALWALGLSIAFLKPGSAWVLCSLLFCREAYVLSGQSFAAAVARHVALPLLLHVAWTLAMTGNAPLAAGADSAAMWRSLQANPARFPLSLLSTLLAQAGVLIQMLVGVLGWLDVPLAAWAYRLALLALLASLFADAPQSLPRRAWVVPTSLALAAGSIALVAFPLLLFWTPLGSQLIEGLQGRYFLVTLAFVLVHCSVAGPLRLRRLLVPAVVLALLVTNVHALMRLQEAYYVIGRN